MAAYPVWSVLAAQSVVKVDVVVVVACAGCGSSVASGRLRGVGLVEAHLGCRCALGSGAMSFVGAWNQAPAPVPLVEWCTLMALVSSALVRLVMWCLRRSEVSCFCWCFCAAVSGVISVMSCQRAGST